jgi:hypothetical protein
MTEEHVKITHMDDGCTVQLAMCVKGISSRVAGGVPWVFRSCRVWLGYPLLQFLLKNAVTFYLFIYLSFAPFYFTDLENDRFRSLVVGRT